MGVAVAMIHRDDLWDSSRSAKVRLFSLRAFCPSSERTENHFLPKTVESTSFFGWRSNQILPKSSSAGFVNPKDRSETIAYYENLFRERSKD